MSDSLYPSDLFGIASRLTDPEQAKLAQLRRHLDDHVRPLLSERWDDGASLADIREPLGALRLYDDPTILDGDGVCRPLYRGFVTLELARLDLAVAITFGGQVNMFRGLVHAGGSEDQIRAWDSAMLDFSFTGCFALTEPAHGSDVAQGLEMSAELTGGEWTLNGEKRWIGNASISDNILVIAREVDSDRVLAFVVPTASDGLSIDVIGHKGALRSVQNADIRFCDVVVPESRRLPRIERFADVARALKPLRTNVVWSAAGMQIGAYDAAIRYAKERQQFGRAIAGYQLIQEKLVRIAANIGQTLTVGARLLERDDAPSAAASLGKLIAADNLRESVALAREIVGGNGLVLDYEVMKFFGDAEAVYTFEGTREINSLIVGRHLTGLSAFV